MQSFKAFDLWKNFLQENWRIYFIGSLAVILTDISQVISTRITGWIIDFFSGKEIPEMLQHQDSYQNFLILFGVLLGSRVSTTLGRMGWRLTLARQTHHASSVLRGMIWDHVRLFKKRDLETDFTKGVLLNASNSDVNHSRFIFGFTLVAVIDVVFLGIFTLCAMWMIHKGMTILSLAVLLLIPIFVKRLSEKEIALYSKAQEALSRFDDLAAQVVSTIRLQRLTQTGGYWEKRLNKEADDYRLERLSAVFTSLRYIPTMGSASLLSYLILFGFGIHYVLQGHMTVGDFVAMQGLIFLLQDPLMELGFIISDWKKGMTSLERLSEIYRQDKDPSLLIEGESVEDSTDIVLKTSNLNFRYQGKDSHILEKVNLEIRKGERLGISGPIGSGKSTLVNILSGLERNHSGDVEFLGKKFNAYEHSELRHYMGLVHQKTFLFADTIRNNISIDKEMSDEEIWHYLEIAGLKMDVEGFADQLDTPLGEWGINLSGGQKQRLTLARAISRKPQLLFLDDCLSAVDTVTEENILQALDKELKETTLVWVAHRKSTLKYCDQFLELGEGSV